MLRYIFYIVIIMIAALVMSMIYFSFAQILFESQKLS